MATERPKSLFTRANSFATQFTDQQWLNQTGEITKRYHRYTVTAIGLKLSQKLEAPNYDFQDELTNTGPFCLFEINPLHVGRSLLTKAQQELASIDQQLAEPQMMVPNPIRDRQKGSLPIILGRIAVLLHRKRDQLPWGLAWARRFRQPQHPLLLPLIERREVLTEQLTTLTETRQRQQQRFENWVDRKIGHQVSGQHRSLQRYLECLEQWSGLSADKTRQYITLFPERSIEAINAYASQQSISETRLAGDFPKFFKDVRPRLYPNISDSKLQKRYPELFDEAERLTPTQYQKLPESLQLAWRKHLIDDLALEVIN